MDGISTKVAGYPLPKVNMTPSCPSKWSWEPIPDWVRQSGRLNSGWFFLRWKIWGEQRIELTDLCCHQLPWEPTFPSFLGVLTHIGGFKAFIFPWVFLGSKGTFIVSLVEDMLKRFRRNATADSAFLCRRLSCTDDGPIFQVWAPPCRQWQLPPKLLHVYWLVVSTNPFEKKYESNFQNHPQSSGWKFQKSSKPTT